MSDHDYRCMMRYYSESDTLFIANCTQPLRELFNIAADCEGYPLGEQLPAPLTRWIYHTFRYLVHGKRSILAFKEFGGQFMAVKMSYEAPLLSIYIQPFKNKMLFDRLYYSNNLSRISADRFFGSFVFSMILAKNGDSFVIEHIDESTAKAFSAKQGDEINSMLKNFCCIQSDKIFRYCLSNHKFLHFADVYDSSGSLSYYILGMVPLKCGRITLTFHSLDEHEYYRLISGCAIDNDVPTSEMDIGVAVFKTQGSSRPFLAKHNAAYDMLTSHDGDLNYIFNTLILDSILSSNIVSAPHRFGNTDCIAAAIPFPKEGKVFIFILPVVTTAASATILDNKLTPRENEIASLISSGNSTADVAALCGISLGTVKKTISNIYSKLNISSRAELVRLVLIHSDRAGQ